MGSQNGFDHHCHMIHQDLIIKGEVSVRPGDVQRLTPRGLRLADGTEAGETAS